MKVVAAYLLAVLGGNPSPSAADIKNILGSVGAEADDAMIDFLLSQVEGKDLNELIAVGREKQASISDGGATVTAAAATTAGVGGSEANDATSAPAATEPKKEEVEEEVEEDFCLDLFG